MSALRWLYERSHERLWPVQLPKLQQGDQLYHRWIFQGSHRGMHCSHSVATPHNNGCRIRWMRDIALNSYHYNDTFSWIAHILMM